MSLVVADLEKNLKTATKIWAYLIVLAALLVIFLGDNAITQWVIQQKWVFNYKDHINFVSDKGLYPFYAFFIAIIVLSIWKKNKVTLRYASGYLIAQMLGSFLAVRTIKMLAGRARPEAVEKGIGDNWIGFTWDNAFHSFPSGHTADLFTSAFFIAIMSKNRWVQIFSFACATIVGATRVILTKHYLSDVIVAALIGGIFSILTIRLWILPALNHR